ncbi:MAG TPA: GNAT family N-acetyltransferase [Kofleriaceae bacterium]|nr:GNAT family N-acetyltransferase [Kofleriaceae bacterium]
MDIEIRRAVPADAAALIAHLKALAHEPGINIPLAPDENTLTVAEERDRLLGFDDNPRALLLVATRGDELLGELTVRGLSTRRAVQHVATLGMSVRADARGQGVGTALLEAALEWAADCRFSRVELYVYARNAPAIALYEKHGFVLEGRRKHFIRDGDQFLDDLVMARVST